MSTESSILLAIKPQHYQGKKLFPERWSAFVSELRSQLKESGFEDSDSNETLLLFSFGNPTSAITTLCQFINQTKSALDCQAGDTAIPLQIILHLSQPETKYTLAYRNPRASIWELLGPGTIHVCKAIHSSWQQLMAKSSLLPSTFSSDGDGLFKLHLAPGAITAKDPLLSYRSLSHQGDKQPCFYCGMRSHQPSQCPSKYLTMEHDALSAVGYLPFAQLNQAYKNVFSNQDAINKVLASGITSSQIRKNAELLVLVGFLEINKCYQLRFLWNLTFCRFSKWQAVVEAEQVEADNKRLQLGLDCLRVGKYPQAEQFFEQEFQAKSNRRFPATVGFAFVALETQGLAKMRNLLETAQPLATQPKEQIYIALLLSRAYDLLGDAWKARDTMKTVLVAHANCTEAMYRRLQIEVKENCVAEACQLLHVLMLDQRELYMAALMDPVLLPIQTKVEDLLLTQYNAKLSNAQDCLSQAEQGINDLNFWLDSQDPGLLSHNATLDKLQKKIERKSYFDVLDVEHKGKGLVAANHQLKEAKQNELYEQINQAKARREENASFWNRYRYQMVFKNFGTLLFPAEKSLQEASTLAKENAGESYKKAIDILRETEQTLDSLCHLRTRMELVSQICDNALHFTKNLTLTEIGGAILVNALIFGLSHVPENHALAAIGTDPLLQKKALFLTAFVFSPILALAMTIRRQIQR
ncbi:MAG: hypothetical protein PHI06_09310 [Desulfobulbaceae bacterium]|nr:hypothetical protein [Desulfobulbaceae bacterium]